MDVMLKKGFVTNEMVDRMAELIAGFHKRADINPYISGFGRPSAIRKDTDENFSQTLSFIGETISAERYSRVKDYVGRF